MSRFRKHPVEIEAHRFMFFDADKAGRPEFDGPLPQWLKEALAKPKNEIGAIFPGVVWSGQTQSELLTLRINGGVESSYAAHPGDWIIRGAPIPGVRGELFVCRPDIFAATYDRVERGDAFHVPQALAEDIEDLNERNAKLHRALATILSIAKDVTLAGAEITQTMSDEIDVRIEQARTA